MLFFAAWCVIMTLYIILCLPETKGVPIEEIVVVWRKHWLWKRCVTPAAVDMNGGEHQRNKGAHVLHARLHIIFILSGPCYVCQVYLSHIALL